ncbi:hypothetical protein [Microcoleus sp. PH2017_28_MFU_U_A]|nr:hypothetical protein [Microcoleus sp. PH2017_28_MFU_U_A]MCC3589615.1 hypothetical protein [Microcoleus sp. PH2017_28_MFU_U_A]
MNSVILISPDRGYGFQPILSGKHRAGFELPVPRMCDVKVRACEAIP